MLILISFESGIFWESVVTNYTYLEIQNKGRGDYSSEEEKMQKFLPWIGFVTYLKYLWSLLMYYILHYVHLIPEVCIFPPLP